MVAGIIIAVIGAIVLIRYLLSRRVKKVKYVSERAELSDEEFQFYLRLSAYSKNFVLYLDRRASEHAKFFADYCDEQDKPVSGHEGVGIRIAALTSKGATNVSEIYSGGYRTLDTAIQRLKESEKHNKVMIGNYTHIGVGVTGNHYVAIYFNILWKQRNTLPKNE